MLKRILLVLLVTCCTNSVFSQIDSILSLRNSQYNTKTDEIFPTISGYEAGSLLKQKKLDDNLFNKWLQENYFEFNADSESLASDPNIFLDDIEDVDPRKERDLLRRSFAKLTKPIVLSSGLEVELEFGRTKDGVNSDLVVSKLLIKGLTEALETANEFLEKQGIPAITNIYISSTSNGVHSSSSNHYRKEALDIAMINGRSIRTSRRSQRRKDRLLLIARVQNKTLKDYEAFGNLSVENVYFDVDDIYLADRVKALQYGIAKLEYYRENFGPFLKFKYTKEDNETNYDYKIGGHEGHIHFAVR